MRSLLLKAVVEDGWYGFGILLISDKLIYPGVPNFYASLLRLTSSMIESPVFLVLPPK